MAAFECVFADRESEDDLYSLLGCSESSSVEQITKEYHIKAKLCHPDKSTDEKAQETFKKINRAYEILSNQEMRRMYDSWKSSGVAMSFDCWISLQNRFKSTMHFGVTKGPLKLTTPSKPTSKSPEFEKQTVSGNTTSNLLSEYNGSSSSSLLQQFRTYKI